MKALIFDLPEPKPITLYNAWELFLPASIIFVQLWLLLGEEGGRKGSTKTLRIALLPFALTACWHVFAHLILPYDQLACVNFGSGVAMQHLAITSLRWTFADEPPRRKPDAVAHPRYIQAFELLYNARMVGYEGRPDMGDASLSKRQHLFYQLKGLIIHYLFFDVCSYYVQRVSPMTFGSYRGGSVSAFAHDVAAGSASPLLVEQAIRTGLTFACGWLTYHGICLLWHVLAIVGILTIHKGEEYPRLMDRPLLADSMLDFWKRWHQLIRSLLVFATSVLPSSTPQLIQVLMVFFFSGQLHTIGQLVITRHLCIPLPSLSNPNPLIMVDRMARFFIACGCASILEVVFKRLTGRKVHGLFGRVWLATVLLSTAQDGAEEWYAMGFVGSMRGLMGMAPVLSLVEWLRWAAGFDIAPWRRIDMS